MATKGSEKGATKPVKGGKPQQKGKGQDEQLKNLDKAFDFLYGKKGDGSNRA